VPVPVPLSNLPYIPEISTFIHLLFLNYPPTIILNTYSDFPFCHLLRRQLRCFFAVLFLDILYNDDVLLPELSSPHHLKSHITPELTSPTLTSQSDQTIQIRCQESHLLVLKVSADPVDSPMLQVSCPHPYQASLLKTGLA
jgi:hypothetical protein